MRKCGLFYAYHEWEKIDNPRAANKTNLRMAKKITPLHKIRGNSQIDSVQERRTRFGDKKNPELLEKCATLWENLYAFRNDRARCKRYVYGDQWGDFVTYKGKTMTEEQYIKSQGNVPLKNNLIRRLVNNVTGLYTKSETEPVATARDRDEQRLGEMMTTTLQCNWQTNKMPVLLSVLIEDYLIGGAAVCRESVDIRNGRKDIYSTIVNPNYLFFDSTMNDPRFWDVSLIGQIHDLTFKELCHKFAASEDAFDKLTQIYRSQANDKGANIEDITKRHDLDRMSFLSPQDLSLCRVYEIWTRETKPRYRCHDPETGQLYRVEVEEIESIKKENEARKKMGKEYGIPEEDIPLISYDYIVDYFWFFQFLTPYGDVLLDGETPFYHESHPYVLSLYPFIDGEIHSFVADFIDQQRYINRLITIDDFVRRSGAKGITMVPEGCIPDGMSLEEFAEQWSSVDGLIVYKPKAGVPEPKQFYSSAVHLNTAEMVQLQINLMEDISSVHSAMQGKQTYSGTSAALYSQQAANSTAALSSLLLRFSAFVEEIAVKKTKLIQQYYDEKRIINIAGKGYASIKEYDPEKARDVEFDLSIKESASTPVHRMIANDMLLEFWKSGAITIEMLLENGDFPFADNLLQSIRSRQETAEQKGIQSLDQGAVAQVGQAANKQNVANAEALMRQ